jgi:hypothetical protein
MDIYEHEVVPLSGLSYCSVSAVFKETDGYSVFIFKQPDACWCPYTRTITTERTLKLRMKMTEYAMRSYMVYNRRYIRCIYAHKPLIKDGEEEEDIFNQQVSLQVMEEYNQPYIDEFGLYVYMRLEISELNYDVDLRYDADPELEKLYNYDLRISEPSSTGDGLQTNYVQPSLATTV